MKKLLKSYKTEINPTQEQKQIIHRTIGVCRFVYNFYLAHNKEMYEKDKIFVGGIDFSKWLNNDFIPNNLEYKWIKEVSSKSLKQSIMTQTELLKISLKRNLNFQSLKRKINLMLKCILLKQIVKLLFLAKGIE